MLTPSPVSEASAGKGSGHCRQPKEFSFKSALRLTAIGIRGEADQKVKWNLNSNYIPYNNKISQLDNLLYGYPFICCNIYKVNSIL